MTEFISFYGVHVNSRPTVRAARPGRSYPAARWSIHPAHRLPFVKKAIILQRSRQRHIAARPFRALRQED